MSSVNSAEKAPRRQEEVELTESPRRSTARVTATLAIRSPPLGPHGDSSPHKHDDGSVEEEEEDEDVLTFTREIAAASTTRNVSASTRKSTHRSTPSTTALLGNDERSNAFDEHIDDPDASTRWARLRSDYEDERVGILGLFDKISGFVKRNEGFLLIFIAQAFFATISACVKALQERIAMPVWELILIRMSLTWAGCYIYMRLNHIEHPLLGPPGVRVLLAARGFVGFWGIFPLYYSLRYIPLSDATVLGFLAPFMVGILGTVFLREPYTLTEGVVALISLFGVVLIAKPSFLFPYQSGVTTPDGVTPHQRTLAVLACLGSSFGAAGAYLLIRRIGKRASATHSISYFAIYCVIVSSIYPLIVHSPPVLHLMDPMFWILLTPIGIFGFIAQALLTLGLQRENAGRGSLAVFSNLLFAMIIEKVAFGKLPDVLSLIGAAIIVSGGVKIALMKASITKQPVNDDNVDEEGEIGAKVENGISRPRSGSTTLGEAMDSEARQHIVTTASVR